PAEIAGPPATSCQYWRESAAKSTASSPEGARQLVPREAHGFLGGAEEGAGLVENLLMLGGGIAVGDDAAARLHHHLAVLDDGSPDHNASVHAAIAGKVADGTAIEIAPLHLELVDDLHRPHLGRTRKCAGGKSGDEGVHSVVARVYLAFHV